MMINIQNNKSPHTHNIPANMTYVHLHPDDMALMDEVLGGRHIHPHTGKPHYAGLDHIMHDPDLHDIYREHRAGGGMIKGAEHLGRFGDDSIAMITPETKALFASLNAYHGDNPYTHYPEYFGLRDLFSKVKGLFSGNNGYQKLPQEDLLGAESAPYELGDDDYEMVPALPGMNKRHGMTLSSPLLDYLRANPMPKFDDTGSYDAALGDDWRVLGNKMPHQEYNPGPEQMYSARIGDRLQQSGQRYDHPIGPEPQPLKLPGTFETARHGMRQFINSFRDARRNDQGIGSALTGALTDAGMETTRRRLSPHAMDKWAEGRLDYDPASHESNKRNFHMADTYMRSRNQRLGPGDSLLNAGMMGVGDWANDMGHRTGGGYGGAPVYGIAKALHGAAANRMAGMPYNDVMQHAGIDLAHATGHHMPEDDTGRIARAAPFGLRDLMERDLQDEGDAYHTFKNNPLAAAAIPAAASGREFLTQFQQDHPQASGILSTLRDKARDAILFADPKLEAIGGMAQSVGSGMKHYGGKAADTIGAIPRTIAAKFPPALQPSFMQKPRRAALKPHPQIQELDDEVEPLLGGRMLDALGRGSEYIGSGFKAGYNALPNVRSRLPAKENIPFFGRFFKRHAIGGAVMSPLYRR